MWWCAPLLSVVVWAVGVRPFSLMDANNNTLNGTLNATNEAVVANASNTTNATHGTNSSFAPPSPPFPAGEACCTTRTALLIAIIVVSGLTIMLIVCHFAMRLRKSDRRRANREDATHQAAAELFAAATSQAITAVPPSPGRSFVGRVDGFRVKVRVLDHDGRYDDMERLDSGAGIGKRPPTVPEPGGVVFFNDQAQVSPTGEHRYAERQEAEAGPSPASADDNGRKDTK